MQGAIKEKKKAEKNDVEENAEKEREKDKKDKEKKENKKEKEKEKRKEKENDIKEERKSTEGVVSSTSLPPTESFPPADDKSAALQEMMEEIEALKASAHEEQDAEDEVGEDSPLASSGENAELSDLGPYPILYLVAREHNPDETPWKETVRFAVF